MRVAFQYTFNDSDWLGGRNYYSSLFHAVLEVSNGDIELVLIAGKAIETTLPQQFPEVEVVRPPMLDRGTSAWKVRQAGRLLAGMRRDPAFGSLLRELRVDVLSHASGQGAMAGVKTLGWLPDFQFMHFATNWTNDQLKATRRAYRLTCKNSDALLVSSHDALNDLNAFAPWCERPKHVLHFLPQPVKTAALPSLDDLRGRYPIPGRYAHLPNQFWVHKNHGVVIEALAILKRRGITATVVCTGQTSDVRRPDYFQHLMNQRDQAGLTNSFVVLGMVPYNDMQALMAHACCVINPSRFEGWSTTVEEAKAMRKRVLLSDLPVHREQAPDGAGYFQQDDVETLASLLAESLVAGAQTLDIKGIEKDHVDRLNAFGHEYMAIVASL